MNPKTFSLLIGIFIGKKSMILKRESKALDEIGTIVGFLLLSTESNIT